MEIITMKIANFKILIPLALVCTSLFSNDELGIDSLLNDIEKKTDLSEKTKIENSGITFIFTRDDIQRMQARYLKDLLKSGTTFGYAENRYGFNDPMTNGDFVVFQSSLIRVYIDNQEITAGMYGSGMLTYGNIDLGFVDHVEIYTQNPTYEYVTEPTTMLIKLYSKSALKDEGSKVELNVGSFGDVRGSAYNSKHLNKDWSYFTYASAINNKRKKHNSFGTELSRDSKDLHLFASFKTAKHNITVDALKFKKDTFADASFDATPTQAEIDVNSLHVGYDGIIDDFSLLATYDYVTNSTNFKDDVTPTPINIPIKNREVDSQAHTLTGEVKYKVISTKNSLAMGLKFRYKKFDVKKYIINDEIQPDKTNTAQAVSTVFLEDDYSIMDNLNIIAGLQYVHVDNKGARYNKTNSLPGYRVGLTYLNDKWIFKTIASHSEAYLEPYLVDSSFIVTQDIDNFKSDTIYEDIIYEHENNRYEFIAGYVKLKNYLIPNQVGKLHAYDKKIDLYTALTRWTHHYNQYDKLFAEITYTQINNLPMIKRQKLFMAVIRSLNTYEKFDIFNELIYNRNNLLKNNYFDWGLGVKYHYSKDLTLSLKGENLLNDAKETSFMRMDPTTFVQEEPLLVSPIDQKVTFSVEYLF